MKEQIAHGTPLPRRASALAGQSSPQHTSDVPNASRHRAGHYAGLHPEDRPDQSQMGRRRAPPPASFDEEDSEEESADVSTWRSPRSALIRSRMPPIAATSPATIAGRPRGKSRLRLVLMGIGMLCALALCTTWNSLSSWWQHTQDDLSYGHPRTYQVDAVVGHGDSASHPSHFIALNLHGQIEVIELAGGDPTRVQVYVGPTLYGPGSDEVPITLTFDDVNGDGKPDLELHVEGNLVVFLNNGKTFLLSHA
jgi:hypothetical protein